MIRSILFKGRLKGRGIVNFDSTDQRWVLKNRFPQERDYLSHKNVKIAKHHFYVKSDAEGQPVWERRLCISADCLRQAIFGEDFPFQNTTVMHHPSLLFGVLASVPALLRGYFFAEEGKPALKRKSPVMITAAEQDSKAVSHFEIGTMSGAKRSKSDEDDSSDTSMHYEEKIGEVEYGFEGAIDLRELQFISFSETYDRLAVNRDYEDQYRTQLGQKIGSEINPVHFYVAKSAVIRMPEEGILLTQNQVALLVQEFFRRLLGLRIQRSKGYAELQEVRVKMVRNPMEDVFDDAGGWHLLKDAQGLSLIPNDIAIFYERIPDEEAKALDQVIREQTTNRTRQKKAKREAKQEAVEDATQGSDN